MQIIKLEKHKGVEAVTLVLLYAEHPLACLLSLFLSITLILPRLTESSLWGHVTIAKEWSFVLFAVGETDAALLRSLEVAACPTECVVGKNAVQQQQRINSYIASADLGWSRSAKSLHGGDFSSA